MLHSISCISNILVDPILERTINRTGQYDMLTDFDL